MYRVSRQLYEEQRPLSKGERWTYVVFFILLVGTLAGETFINYKPVKLSILFFVLTWFPLLAIHELGHALAARMCGWHVRKISLGMGRLFRTYQLGSTRLDVRVIPIEGYVVPVPHSMKNVRIKSAFIYFAGTGFELFILGVFALVIGPGTLLSKTDSIPIILVQTFGVAVGLSVIGNWIPRSSRQPVGGGYDEWTANDGLGMIRSFTKPLKYFEAQVSED